MPNTFKGYTVKQFEEILNLRVGELDYDQVAMFPTTLEENRENRLKDIYKKVIEEDKIAVVPVLTSEANGQRHWTSFLAVPGRNGKCKIIFADPAGKSHSKDVISKIFSKLNQDQYDEVVDLSSQNGQQSPGSNNCGPYAVENALKMLALTRMRRGNVTENDSARVSNIPAGKSSDQHARDIISMHDNLSTKLHLNQDANNIVNKIFEGAELSSEVIREKHQLYESITSNGDVGSEKNKKLISAAETTVKRRFELQKYKKKIEDQIKLIEDPNFVDVRLLDRTRKEESENIIARIESGDLDPSNPDDIEEFCKISEKLIHSKRPSYKLRHFFKEADRFLEKESEANNVELKEIVLKEGRLPNKEEKEEIRSVESPDAIKFRFAKEVANNLRKNSPLSTREERLKNSGRLEELRKKRVERLRKISSDIGTADTENYLKAVFGDMLDNPDFAELIDATLDFIEKEAVNLINSRKKLESGFDGKLKDLDKKLTGKEKELIGGDIDMLKGRAVLALLMLMCPLCGLIPSPLGMVIDKVFGIAGGSSANVAGIPIGDIVGKIKYGLGKIPIVGTILDIPGAVLNTEISKSGFSLVGAAAKGGLPNIELFIALGYGAHHTSKEIDHSKKINKFMEESNAEYENLFRVFKSDVKKQLNGDNFATAMLQKQKDEFMGFGLAKFISKSSKEILETVFGDLSAVVDGKQIKISDLAGEDMFDVYALMKQNFAIKQSAVERFLIYNNFGREEFATEFKKFSEGIKKFGESDEAKKQEFCKKYYGSAKKEIEEECVKLLLGVAGIEVGKNHTQNEYLITKHYKELFERANNLSQNPGAWNKFPNADHTSSESGAISDDEEILDHTSFGPNGEPHQPIECRDSRGDDPRLRRRGVTVSAGR